MATKRSRTHRHATGSPGARECERAIRQYLQRAACRSHYPAVIQSTFLKKVNFRVIPKLVRHRSPWPNAWALVKGDGEVESEFERNQRLAGRSSGHDLCNPR